ncbi:hypothetical protein BZG36_01677 [Bifiguratus adelaidae]|uniref:J domain-containing protein n=1 Tax=Bifiguratus adelaidae TaxID=1938954 RepID=A0A261Y4M0_9FUNG|nr:hypothetical protein BZG36_01677 [Bifiguratus adelaidae]
MEVNKDEAERCLLIAQKHRDSGNIAAAIKFTRKSITLYPTDSAEALLQRLLDQDAKGGGASASSSSTNARTEKFSSAAGKSTSAQTSPSDGQNVKSREHRQMKREYTEEQVAAVKRIRACGSDYYKILGLEKTCTENEVRKAYRKLALQFHPDKNGAPGADEAFKMISKAFTVLSDTQKRAIFDAGGMDPEQRSAAAPGFSGMNGFSSARYGGGPMFADEVSPEDLFNMFFGGDFAGGGFQSATFMGPGFRTRTYTSAPRPRAAHQQRGNSSTWLSLVQILPLIILFFFSFASSLFGSDNSNDPGFSFKQTSTYNQFRQTPHHHVHYYINPNQFNSYVNTPRKLREFEKQVEMAFVQNLQHECRREERSRQILMQEAQGGLFGIGFDRAKWNQAREMKTPSCDRLRQEFGFRG